MATPKLGMDWISARRLASIACFCGLLSAIGMPEVSAAPAPVARKGAIGADAAGRIDLVEGEARIMVKGTEARPARVGDQVNEGDTLITGKNGEIHMTMQDAGFIALRPGTRFTVISYHADADDKDRGIFSLVSGGFRSVTGWIGKFNRPSYQVRTPTATIGIRGTDHEPRYIPEGSSEGPAGTYDKVYAGESFIQTAQGETAITPDQAGYASSGSDQPHRLDQVPGFFRPSRHESYISKKHAEIQAVIEERREARKKFMAERKAELAEKRAEKNAEQVENRKALDERMRDAKERERERQEARKASRRDRD